MAWWSPAATPPQWAGCARARTPSTRTCTCWRRRRQRRLLQGGQRPGDPPVACTGSRCRQVGCSAVCACWRHCAHAGPAEAAAQCLADKRRPGDAVGSQLDSAGVGLRYQRSMAGAQYSCRIARHTQTPPACACAGSSGEASAAAPAGSATGPAPREYHTLTAFANGRLLLFGGAQQQGWQCGCIVVLHHLDAGCSSGC